MSASASSGVCIALLDLERDFVGAAVLRAAQRADRAGDRRVDVRARARDHAGGERRGVEFVLGVQDSARHASRAPTLRRRLAVQQMQEVPADGVVVGLDFDALAVVRVVVPVAAASSRARPSAGRRCRARPRRCGRPSRAARVPSTDTPVRITSIGCAAAGSCFERRLARRRADRADALSLAL